MAPAGDAVGDYRLTGFVRHEGDVSGLDEDEGVDHLAKFQRQVLKARHGDDNDPSLYLQCGWPE